MSKKFVHKIHKKSKYSYTITLPKEIIDNFSWRDNQKIVITTYGKNKILIFDWEPKKKKR